jgi:threonylcarbamoyladenosine tRNA methylthiotransferase MtaB
MRIAIYTLGCKVNQTESASIEGLLRENGHEIVTDIKDNPDVCVINTCTVTAKSDTQSRQIIRQAARSGARVVATGCYAQLRPEELSEIKGVNLVIGNSEKNNISEHMNRLSFKDARCSDNNFQLNLNPDIIVDKPEYPVNLKTYYSNRSRAFLKIQDGCNFSCSYCTVPAARGRSRSLGHEDVIKAVDKFSREGFSEIVITGIHIGSYGLDLRPKSSLLEIINKISKAYSGIRLRLSSLEPGEFKRDFLFLIKKGFVCPHLHIPLQSGSDAVLKKMKRGYSVSYFESLIQDIVYEHPGISIGTDVIVGFPGETENDFRDTQDLLERLPLSYIHVFPYSERPGTEASVMKGQVGGKIKRKRVEKVMEISKKKKNRYTKSYLGSFLNVIIEKKSATRGLYSGISENYLRTFVRSNHQVVGSKLCVKAISLLNDYLITVPSYKP